MPTALGGGQFRFGPAALREEQPRARMAEGLREVEETIERRERPGRDDVLDRKAGAFDAALHNRDGEAEPAGRFPKEGGLSAIGLDERELCRLPFSGKDRSADKAGKSGAGAKINPAPCLRRREFRQLGAVENVPAPELLFIRAGDEIDALVPGGHVVGKFAQQRNCFTWNKPVWFLGSHAAPARGARLACARSRVSAAGVIPSIRAAWARLPGRTVESLPCSSDESPGMAA